MNVSGGAPLISVIVPVYNSEKFLERTLNSILYQTFKDFEVIIINDGSTDSSGDIIDSYKNKFRICKTIRVENGGASRARNLGINRADGEYVSFIDSDDFVSPFFLERLYDNARRFGADISCCNYYRYLPRLNLPVPDVLCAPSGVYSSEKLLGYLITDVRVHYYLWNKLFKRSLFRDYGITIPDGYFEDMAVVPRLFYLADKICVDSRPAYYYTKRAESAVGSFDEAKLQAYVEAFGSIREFLEEAGIYDKYKTGHTALGYRILLSSVTRVLGIYYRKGGLRQAFRSWRRVLERVKYFTAKDIKRDIKRDFKKGVDARSDLEAMEETTG